jgi:hypothetical protein
MDWNVPKSVCGREKGLGFPSVSVVSSANAQTLLVSREKIHWYDSIREIIMDAITTNDKRTTESDDVQFRRSILSNNACSIVLCLLYTQHFFGLSYIKEDGIRERRMKRRLGMYGWAPCSCTRIIFGWSNRFLSWDTGSIEQIQC